MKLVVVYESMFGNTKTIGEAIAEGLDEAARWRSAPWMISHRKTHVRRR